MHKALRISMEGTICPGLPRLVSSVCVKKFENLVLLHETAKYISYEGNQMVRQQVNTAFSWKEHVTENP